jgi:hypothetical protein
MIQVVDIVSGAENQVSLSMSATGAVVSVGAGAFTHLGQDRNLDDDVETDFGVESFDRVIFGYLVQVVATDEITVLWDVMGPGDRSFSFEANGPYMLICKLAALEVPADADDFAAESVSFQHFRIVEEA